MEVTAGVLHDAYRALADIINRPRQIPQMAKYRIAKLHSALQPFYEPIEARRAEIIERIGEEVFEDEAKTKSAGWGVKPGSPQFEEYLAEWNRLRAETVTLPSLMLIDLGMLGNEVRGIEAHEFKALEPFIHESVPTEGNASQGA